MIQMYLSLLAAKDGNFLNFAETHRCDGFHLDMIDGYYAPNLGVPHWIIPALRQLGKPIQVHLMVKEPEKFVELVLPYRPDSVFFHVETARDPAGLIEGIKCAGSKVGIVWDNNTDLVQKYFHLMDEILFMTVKPGFGGQSFVVERLEEIDKIMRKLPETKLTWVDGGVNGSNLGLIRALGVTGAVAGSGIDTIYS